MAKETHPRMVSHFLKSFANIELVINRIVANLVNLEQKPNPFFKTFNTLAKEKQRAFLSKIFVETKVCFKFARSNKALTHGVIGNTAGFGPVVLGSSPSGSTKKLSKAPKYRGFYFLGDGIGDKKLKFVPILIWRNKEHFRRNKEHFGCFKTLNIR